MTVPFNDGELFPVSNDPDGLQGLDPSLAIVDEIGFQPVQSWDSLRMGAGKRARSTIIGVGTPGFDHDNALYHVRKAIREGAKLPGLVFREFAAPEGCRTDDRKAWRKANPAIRAGFLRESALVTDLGITPEGHFRLFRLGQHIEGTDSWLGAYGAGHLGRPRGPLRLRGGRSDVDAAWTWASSATRRPSWRSRGTPDGLLHAAGALLGADRGRAGGRDRRHGAPARARHGPTTSGRSASTPASSTSRPRCSPTRACRWSRSRRASSA